MWRHGLWEVNHYPVRWWMIGWMWCQLPLPDPWSMGLKKLLPEPMLTYQWWSSVMFHSGEGNFLKNAQDINFEIVLRNTHLTLLVLKLKSTRRIRSILGLLMPWFLASPGDQQPCYWICRMNGSLYYMRKDFNDLIHLSIANWYKMQIYFLIS